MPLSIEGTPATNTNHIKYGLIQRWRGQTILIFVAELNE